MKDKKEESSEIYGDSLELKFISHETFVEKLNTYLKEDFISEIDFNSLDGKLKKLCEKNRDVDYDCELLRLEIQLEEKSVSYRRNKKGEFLETKDSILELFQLQRGIVNINNIFLKKGVLREAKDSQVEKYQVKIKEISEKINFSSLELTEKLELKNDSLVNLKEKEEDNIFEKKRVEQLNIKNEEFQKELQDSYKLKFISKEEFQKKLNDSKKVISEKKCKDIEDKLFKLDEKRKDKELSFDLEYDFELLVLDLKLLWATHSNSKLGRAQVALKMEILKIHEQYFKKQIFKKERDFEFEKIIKNKEVLLQKVSKEDFSALKFISKQEFNERLETYLKFNFISEKDFIRLNENLKKLDEKKSNQEFVDLEYDFELLQLDIELELKSLSFRKEEGLFLDIPYDSACERQKLRQKILNIQNLYYMGLASKEIRNLQMKECENSLIELNINDQNRSDFFEKELISQDVPLHKKKYKSNFEELLNQGLITQIESDYQIKELSSKNDVNLDAKFREVQVKTLDDAKDLLKRLKEAYGKRYDPIEIDGYRIRLIAAVSKAKLKEDEAFKEFEKECNQLKENLEDACVHVIFLENRRLFNNILPEELVGCEYSAGKDREKYPNLFLMTTFLNTITARVQWQILTDIEEKESAVKRMEFWINIAYKLLYKGDTNAAHAMTSAFLTQYIFRLWDLKEILSLESKKKLEELQKLFKEPDLLVMEWLNNKPKDAAKKHYPLLSFVCLNLNRWQGRIAHAKNLQEKEITPEFLELLKTKNISQENYFTQLSNEISECEKNCKIVRDSFKELQQSKDDFFSCEYYSYPLLQAMLVLKTPTEKFLKGQSFRIEPKIEVRSRSKSNANSKSTFFIINGKKSDNKDNIKRLSLEKN